MKKIIAYISCVLTIHYTTHAQVDTRAFILSLAPEVSIPVGGLKQTNKIGLGGNVFAQFSLAEKLKFLVSLSGRLHKGKTYNSELGYEDEYPALVNNSLKGGIKYFLSDAIFIAGNAGPAYVTQRGESKISFSYAPQIGCELGGVDLLLKYDAVCSKTSNGATIQAIGFCIGYRL